jgi:hypothetical protein
LEHYIPKVRGGHNKAAALSGARELDNIKSMKTPLYTSETIMNINIADLK